MPQVSVVVPAFNAEKTLEHALGSIVAQTLTDWEAVVADDGSRDGTVALAERWARNDRRIRVLRHDDAQNHGRGATRNLGVRSARSAIVAFLDADDALCSWTLQAYVDAFRCNARAGVVYGQAEEFGEGRAGTVSGRGVDGVPMMLFDQLARFNVVVTSATAVRLTALRHVSFPEEMPLSQDWACWLELARSWPFVFLGRVLVRYRVHAESGTQRMRAAGREAEYELAQARWLQRVALRSTPAERTCVRKGLEFRAISCFLRGFSAVRRLRLDDAASWWRTATGVAGSLPIAVAALCRLPGEQRRRWRGLDPPLTAWPAVGA